MSALVLALLCALTLADLPVWVQGLGAALALTWGWRARSVALPELRCDAQGRLALGEGGVWRKTELLEAVAAPPFFLQLRYRIEGRRPRALLLLADNLSASDYRRLLVWRRWRGTRPAQAKTP